MTMMTTSRSDSNLAFQITREFLNYIKEAKMAQHTTPPVTPPTADELADLLGTTPVAEKSVKKARVKKAKPAAKWPPEKDKTNGAAKQAAEPPAKTTTKAAPAKTATKAKAPVKKSAKASAKPAAKAKTRRGDGQFSQHVAAATAKVKAMRTGSSATTKDLAEKYDLPKYSFRVAARRMEKEGLCKVKNKDRVNTITRS